MDIGVRNELPKPGQDTRYLLDQQRSHHDRILKEAEEFEQRAKYLENKIQDMERKIFDTPMGAKICELVRENLSLSIDVQCLSIQVDIHNQGLMDPGRSAGPSAYASPNRSYPVSPIAYGGAGGSGVSPSGIQRSISPNNNVVTLDTSTYPYAQVISPSSIATNQPQPHHHQSPYPLQPPAHHLQPLQHQLSHYAHHHHQQPSPQLISGRMHHHLDPNRAMIALQQPQPSPPSALYNFERQGSLNILNQVPPPPGGWNTPPVAAGNVSPNLGPPIPPRPTDLLLAARTGRLSSGSSSPHRPVPAPPNTNNNNNNNNLPRSPARERPRSSNGFIAAGDVSLSSSSSSACHDDRNHENENIAWECFFCTFQNHSAISVCEMCNNPRNVHDSIGKHTAAASPAVAQGTGSSPTSSSAARSPTSPKISSPTDDHKKMRTHKSSKRYDKKHDRRS